MLMKLSALALYGIFYPGCQAHNQIEVEDLRRRWAGTTRANKTASTMGIAINTLPVVDTPPELPPTTMPTVNDTSSPETFVPTSAAR